MWLHFAVSFQNWNGWQFVQSLMMHSFTGFCNGGIFSWLLTNPPLSQVVNASFYWITIKSATFIRGSKHMILIMIITCIIAWLQIFVVDNFITLIFLFCMLIDIFGTSKAPSNQCSGFVQVLQVTAEFLFSNDCPSLFTIIAACDKGIDTYNVFSSYQYSIWPQCLQEDIYLDYPPGAESLTWTLISRHLFIYHLNVSWTPQIFTWAYHIVILVKTLDWYYLQTNGGISIIVKCWGWYYTLNFPLQSFNFHNS